MVDENKQSYRLINDSILSSYLFSFFNPDGDDGDKIIIVFGR